MNINSHPGRLNHYTPLRYPGGKGRLAAYVKAIMRANDLLDGDYVEPFAGGAAVALELLFHEYVSKVHINDLHVPVYLFWKAVLEDTDSLCRLVRDTPRSLDEWDRQKNVIKHQRDYSSLDVAFSFFYLNRTNRSGILNGGVIGGRSQLGEWKIDARYNADDLINRIVAISRMRERISVTNLDAVEFLSQGVQNWPSKTLIYCDPPYYVKGKDLYFHSYDHEDHRKIESIISYLQTNNWIVSYDNEPEIREIYKGYDHVIYDIGYSARSARKGSEIMFFGNGLTIPPLTGAITETSRQGTVGNAA